MMYRGRRHLVLAKVVCLKRTGAICYEACVQCYTKILYDSGRNMWLCSKCGTSYHKPMLRYRLLMSITDRKTTCTAALFGKNMDNFLGASALDFERYISHLKNTSSYSEDLLFEAFSTTFVGKMFYFGFKASLPKSGDNVMRVTLADIVDCSMHGLQSSENLVAYQMFSATKDSADNIVTVMRCLEQFLKPKLETSVLQDNNTQQDFICCQFNCSKSTHRCPGQSCSQNIMDEENMTMSQNNSSNQSSLALSCDCDTTCRISRSTTMSNTGHQRNLSDVVIENMGMIKPIVELDLDRTVNPDCRAPIEIPRCSSTMDKSQELRFSVIENINFDESMSLHSCLQRPSMINSDISTFVKDDPLEADLEDIGFESNSSSILIPLKCPNGEEDISFANQSPSSAMSPSREHLFENGISNNAKRVIPITANQCNDLSSVVRDLQSPSKAGFLDEIKEKVMALSESISSDSASHQGWNDDSAFRTDNKNLTQHDLNEVEYVDIGLIFKTTASVPQSNCHTWDTLPESEDLDEFLRDLENQPHAHEAAKVTCVPSASCMTNVANSDLIKKNEASDCKLLSTNHGNDISYRSNVVDLMIDDAPFSEDLDAFLAGLDYECKVSHQNKGQESIGTGINASVSIVEPTCSVTPSTMTAKGRLSSINTSGYRSSSIISHIESSDVPSNKVTNCKNNIAVDVNVVNASTVVSKHKDLEAISWQQNILPITSSNTPVVMATSTCTRVTNTVAVEASLSRHFAESLSLASSLDGSCDLFEQSEDLFDDLAELTGDCVSSYSEPTVPKSTYPGPVICGIQLEDLESTTDSVFYTNSVFEPKKMPQNVQNFKRKSVHFPSSSKLAEAENISSIDWKMENNRKAIEDSRPPERSCLRTSESYINPSAKDDDLKSYEVNTRTIADLFTVVETPVNQRSISLINPMRMVSQSGSYNSDSVNVAGSESLICGSQDLFGDSPADNKSSLCFANSPYLESTPLQPLQHAAHTAIHLPTLHDQFTLPPILTSETLINRQCMFVHSQHASPSVMKNNSLCTSCSLFSSEELFSDADDENVSSMCHQISQSSALGASQDLFED